jgi:hypothetical protein
MTLELKHFDTRLNQFIHTDGDLNNPESILTEKLENTLLEFYFPGKTFSFGHIDEHSKAEDLTNHPEGHILLLSSKTRLLYGPPECLATIEKLCPDRKDRGAYGSIFLGSCKNAIHEQLNILVVDDATGENGGHLTNEDAFKLVGDCYGQISDQLYDTLIQRNTQEDKRYRVIQHRIGWTGTDVETGPGEDNKYRFGKGTLRPYRLEELNWDEKTPKVDIIIPISSFKGTDKDNPAGPIKPQIQPGLYTQTIWLGEKSQSQRGKTAISQLLPSFPQGIKDFTEELEKQAQELADIQKDPRKLAQLYCEKYEKRKAFLTSQETEARDLESGTDEEVTEDKPERDDLLMYKLIKADLQGHQQILETEKVRQELSKFVQQEWRNIAIGKTTNFDRAMIIPSKELKNGEICVPWLEEGEKVLNFRSPFLNSNGLCVSENKHVSDQLGPDGKNLQGIIVVNDEDHKRIQARIEAMRSHGIETNEVDPAETESERQGRDFDGDCIGVEVANKYPNFAAEAEYRNLAENAYAPTVKLKKQSFYRDDGSQPSFEQIAMHMSDSISVGIINNQVTMLEALESEIEILRSYGTNEQKTDYVNKISEHYQSLFAKENDQRCPRPIREEYRPQMEKFIKLAGEPQTPETLHQAMEVNRKIYRKMIEEGCYQNQIAVDLFKSAKTPEMDLIKENNRYLPRSVNYIKDKKKSTSYLSEVITPTGVSPVELLINQANKYFQQSQLESRPIVQFQDLFQGVEYTPQEKLAAILAKQEFDNKFNAATAMERRRETEKGPSAIIQTSQGAQIEITNLTRYEHPGIWKAKTLNIKLEEIPEQQRNSSHPHKLLAVAQVDREQLNGEPLFRPLGTVSQQSIIDYNLKSGIVSNGVTVKEIKPELSKGQSKLLFKQAYEGAEAFYNSIPTEKRLAAAAAAWNISASRQDEVESAPEIQKKVSNFVFAAFPNEIISRLDTLQFTNIKLVEIKQQGNNFQDQVWNPEEEHPIEIRASQYPEGHERHNKRLVFVQEGDEYKELAPLENRTGRLPIGTKAEARIVPGESYTVQGKIQLPGKTPVEFTIREISKFAHAGQIFHGEQVNITIGNVKVPDQTVKIKLGDKYLGELDTESVKQLQQHNYLKDGVTLSLKFKSISEGKGEQQFVIGESPKGNLLRINKVNFYDFAGQTFDDKEHRSVNLEIPQGKNRDAVFLNGEPLGVLHFKKDKDALKDIGVLKPGKLTPVESSLQSNFSHTFVIVNPASVQYPQTWTKENQVFKVPSPVPTAIEQNAAQIIHKINDRPTILSCRPQERNQGVIGMAVDGNKVETVSKWLTSQKVEFSVVPPKDAPFETKKGLVVFNLVKDSIPEKTAEAITKKFGQVIESPTKYLDKIRSLPYRPATLKSTALEAIPNRQVVDVNISGKPVQMAFPLKMHGEPNPLPVSTTIEAMRGYGRTHTTRTYEPYKAYGFKEGDIAIAVAGNQKVAFRVGKQYQITQQMMADPEYQKQWAAMEKHSKKELATFQDQAEVWGLKMEPLGDYVNSKVVLFPGQKFEAPISPPINIGSRSSDPLGAALTNPTARSKELGTVQKGPWQGVSPEQIQATFDQHYVPLLNKAIAAGSSFVVGDAKGTDQLVQNYLKEQGYKLETVSDGYTQAQKLEKVQEAGQTNKNKKTGSQEVSLNEGTKIALAEKESLPVTIDSLREWYKTADKLGRSEEYKQRITEQANEFKSGQPLSDKALAAMHKDFKEFNAIGRFSQIVQRVGLLLGQENTEGWTEVSVQNYDALVNAKTNDLKISDKNQQVVLNIQSGKIKVNSLSLEAINTFENVNQRIDEMILQTQLAGVDIEK